MLSVGLVCSLIFCVSCSGAFSDVRTDRALAVFQSENGPVLVLVSESALKTADTETFRAAWGRSEFTSSEISDALVHYLVGGHCQISGAVIPPVTPEEALKIRNELVAACLDDVAESMRGATQEAIQQAAFERVDAWLPELANIAALRQDEEGGPCPPSPPGI